MNKLSFSQKNDLVVKYKSKHHFGKDLELFKKHFPSNRLMNDLGRTNEFTFEKLDGQMLYLLLDKVSGQDILDNRETKEEPVLPAAADPTVLSSVSDETCSSGASVLRDLRMRDFLGPLW